MLMDQVDFVNPEGHRIMPDIENHCLSELKAAHYLNFGLEELFLSLWIENEREYDIEAAYGISHWWFKRKEFYITRHDATSDVSKVRSHMRILSVISLKTCVRYRYAFLKEVVLCRADYEEYKISEADFKNLHLNDFEDLYMLHLQDCTIVIKPRAVMYRDINDQKKMMQETEVHKFSDGTLHRILKKLDHMVKDFRSKSENKGIVPTEMELVLELTQQGSSYEVSNIRLIPKNYSEDGNPARANIKQALGRLDLKLFRDVAVAAHMK
nr:hypothetical protein [Tanacetum cinerariifolium]